MRILHTSDWHIGRTFHKHSTLDALEKVFDALVAAVVSEQIDVVVAAGDIFDSSTPSAPAVKLLDTFLLRITAAGAKVVLTSGNHDSPERLGARSAFAHAAGVHVLTDAQGMADPISIDDEFGPVHFYGVPYLEPALHRHVWTDAASMRSQKDALGYALDLVRTDWAAKGSRAVILAHTFVAGAEGDSCESERDIVGGVDKVPVSYFSDFTYSALGHIHGRATLAENIRYSGAPLHYSFSEAGKARGGWIVELDGAGIDSVEWLDLPVPRALTVLTGSLEELLSNVEFAQYESDWVSAVIKDQSKPMNAQRRLGERFEHLTELKFQPSVVHDSNHTTYAQKVAGKSDLEIVDTFLDTVRNGDGTSEGEADLLREVVGKRGMK